MAINLFLCRRAGANDKGEDLKMGARMGETAVNELGESRKNLDVFCTRNVHRALSFHSTLRNPGAALEDSAFRGSVCTREYKESRVSGHAVVDSLA